MFYMCCSGILHKEISLNFTDEEREYDADHETPIGLACKIICENAMKPSTYFSSLLRRIPT